MKVRRSTLKILKNEDKKIDSQYSECDDKEETYAYYNETLLKKMCPHVRLFINYVLYQECNNYLQVCQIRNNHALCQECNNYQQLKLSAKNARSTSNSSASAFNTSVSSTKGSVLASTPASFPNNGQQQLIEAR